MALPLSSCILLYDPNISMENIKNNICHWRCHADKSAVETFEMAKLCDNETWIAENVIVVQTGDLTDRGPDGKHIGLFRNGRRKPQRKTATIF